MAPGLSPRYLAKSLLLLINRSATFLLSHIYPAYLWNCTTGLFINCGSGMPHLRALVPEPVMIIYIYVCAAVSYIAYYQTPATPIQGGPPGYFIHFSITTPVVSTLNNYYLLCREASRSSKGYFKPLLGPGDGFRSKTAVT
jgi:hypothetical protein